MKARGATFDEIHLALAAGQRGSLPRLPIDEESSLLPPEKEKRFVLQVQHLQQTLAKVERERDSAIAELQPLKDEIIRTPGSIGSTFFKDMYEAHIQELNEQLKDAQKRVEELIRKAVLSYYRGIQKSQQKDNHSSDS